MLFYVGLIAAALLSILFALNSIWVYLLIALHNICGAKPPSLQGKTVLITGGSSGIGLAIAKECVRRGARVLICARNKERLARARAECSQLIEGASEAVATLSVDLTAPANEVEATLHGHEWTASVDFAILSAGDSNPAAFEDTTPADWDRLLKLNVLGCVWAARCVLPGMKQRRSGRLVFISSMAGQTAVYGYTAYSASKFALRGFVEALRMELKPYGVGTTLVLPPDTNTPLLERENENKPIECKRISEGEGLASAEQVAIATVNGMLSDRGTIHFFLDGWFLSHLTVGMMPSDSYGELLVGVFLWPIIRLYGRYVTHTFDKICEEEHAKRERGSSGATI